MPMIEIRPSLSVALATLLCASCSSAIPIGDTDAGMDGSVEPDAALPNPKCNGHEELCDRRFDEVSFPMTHNAMSNAEAEWVFPNQDFGITRQLNDGIRGMMLDTYEEDGELLLCHVLCALGKQPLTDGLAEITAFLEANPDEIVSIIFENYITHSQTAEAFDESGLIDFVYAHELGEPWPTLSELIAADTRLVVFQEKEPQDPEFPWLMNIWDNAWETPFSFSSPEDLVCDANRGNPANPLFLLNHFLTGIVGGSAELAEMINYNPLFIDRARQCQDEGNALPNFVAVDFYDIGDLFEVVDALNGF
ncbi:MAG: PI-PLC domain-containing protein [Polyangiales bacterium]